MTAEYHTFHTIGGESERVLIGVRGPTVYAPDKRPECDCGACGPSAGKPDHQLEHQIAGRVFHGVDVSLYVGGELMTKVLHAGGPLQRSDRYPVWECERCRMRSTTQVLQQCLQGHEGCPMVGRP